MTGRSTDIGDGGRMVVEVEQGRSATEALRQATGKFMAAVKGPEKPRAAPAGGKPAPIGRSRAAPGPV